MRRRSGDDAALGSEESRERSQGEKSVGDLHERRHPESLLEYLQRVVRAVVGDHLKNSRSTCFESMDGARRGGMWRESIAVALHLDLIARLGREAWHGQC